MILRWNKGATFNVVMTVRLISMTKGFLLIEQASCVCRGTLRSLCQSVKPVSATHKHVRC
jgi:hypothetical protein